MESRLLKTVFWLYQVDEIRKLSILIKFLSTDGFILTVTVLSQLKFLVTIFDCSISVVAVLIVDGMVIHCGISISGSSCLSIYNNIISDGCYVKNSNESYIHGIIGSGCCSCGDRSIDSLVVTVLSVVV